MSKREREDHRYGGAHGDRYRERYRDEPIAAAVGRDTPALMVSAGSHHANRDGYRSNGGGWGSGVGDRGSGSSGGGGGGGGGGGWGSI